MDKIQNPFLIMRKPKIRDEVKFSFVNNFEKQVMFQSLMRDENDFSSINMRTLDKHFKYSYKFSKRKDGKWVDIMKPKILLPEYKNEDLDIEYSYLEYPNSDKLVVVFSSSATIKNVYNYFVTLRDVHVNKLFLA